MASNLVEFSTEQIALVKRTICRPKNREATTDELALFIGQCKRTGLDPFAGQIYAVFRWDGRAKDEKMGIQVSIDGQRAVAERTGTYAGQDGPFWCAADGEWSDTWLSPGELPAAAKVVVTKVLSGHLVHTSAIAHWNEYAVSGNNGLSPMWREKPALMLAKCAEALALRKAFPNDLSGLYVAEEMGRADPQPSALPDFEGRAEALEPSEPAQLEPPPARREPWDVEPDVPIDTEGLPKVEPTPDPAPVPVEESGGKPHEGRDRIPLNTSGLDERVVHILAQAGLHRVGQLRESNWETIMAIPRFGPQSRVEVEKLARFFEFEIPDKGEEADLEAEVRALWLQTGLPEAEIDAKLRNARGNQAVLTVLANAARARIES